MPGRHVAKSLDATARPFDASRSCESPFSHAPTRSAGACSRPPFGALPVCFLQLCRAGRVLDETCGSYLGFFKYRGLPCSLRGSALVVLC